MEVHAIIQPSRLVDILQSGEFEFGWKLTDDQSNLFVPQAIKKETEPQRWHHYIYFLYFFCCFDAQECRTKAMLMLAQA